MLIVAGADAHAEAVGAQLALKGVTSIRASVADLGRVRFGWAPGQELTLEVNGRAYAIGNETTVWWRRPGSFDISDLDPDEGLMVLAEADASWFGALLAVNPRWVDRPDIQTLAELKLLQLQVAKELGNQVPETLVTNDTQTLKEVVRGRYIAKAMSSGPGLAPYVDVLAPTDIEDVLPIPVLLQKLVVAVADLRVVVVGTSAYVWRRPRESTTIDWRQADPSGGAFYPVPSTQELLTASVGISARLGLTMCVQDWLETDGGSVFLEVNSQGNWMFLQSAGEIVAPRLAQHLAAHG